MSTRWTCSRPNFWIKSHQLSFQNLKISTALVMMSMINRNRMIKTKTNCVKIKNLSNLLNRWPSLRSWLSKNVNLLLRLPLLKIKIFLNRIWVKFYKCITLRLLKDRTKDRTLYKISDLTSKPYLTSSHWNRLLKKAKLKFSLSRIRLLNFQIINLVKKETTKQPSVKINRAL